MDEYTGFWINGKGSGVEDFSWGNGYGDGDGDGYWDGNGNGYGDGWGNPTKDHREG